MGDRTRRGQRAERPGAGERDDTGALIRGEQQGGVEAGPDPVVTDRLVLAGVAAEKPQAHARYPGIGLIVRPEHGGEGLGLDHPAVLACAAAQQGRGRARAQGPWACRPLDLARVRRRTR